MMAMNIWQDSTKSVPRQDSQIVRVTMQEDQMTARKDHIPTPAQSGPMAIQHVPNAGSKG